MKEKKDMRDIVIIGAGPAGLTAGLYGCRAKLNVVLLEKGCPGGQIALTDKIENYPGFPEGTSGQELIDNIVQQTKKFGLVIEEQKEIVKIERKDNLWEITSSDKAIYKTLSAIVATGASWKKLDVPGEDKFQGRGVSYCATCDGPLFKNKEVVVVGGGNAAVEEAIFLTKFVKRLILVHRKGMLRATKILQDEIKKNPKIELCLASEVLSVEGDKIVRTVEVKNLSTGEIKKIPCQGVFIFIGQKPNTDFLGGLLNLDENGYVVTDDDMATSAEGIFAAGDIRRKSLRQVATAVSDGACAAYSAERRINTLKGQEYK